MALLSRPHDREPCFFSIHTGAGGADACEWAEMLLRMYMRFFERRGWKVQELDFQPGDEAGIKGVELRVTGAFANGYLRGEIGVHRLVRISPFSGKRETSFAAIDVVPDYQEEINIVIDDKDLKIDTYRAGGKGGQHVNKTDSAVRITHLPSGIVVAVQNERSQHSNKDMALKILKSRLKQREEAARAAQVSAHNAGKSENAWGSQIRNYVMNPYQLVKDVRTGTETGDITKVLDGDLDNFIDAYLRWAVE
jgi:peptide chain release factor 2